MSNLFFWMTVYGKACNLLWVVFNVSLVIVLSYVITMISYLIVGDDNMWYKNQEERYKKGVKQFNFGKKLIKPSLVYSLIFIFIICIISLKPTKQEILTYYILDKVDKYNMEYDQSNFNPENILKNADNTINKIKELSDNLIKKIDKKGE
jgi:formate hydrogenlyase subunit 3/multisubunit Na+/H+ antiporter MnhD subunit